MNVMKDNRGFTLIELLAVIVILAIIIVIASSNIGGLTTTARKNVLAVEGNTLVESAKTAYQLAVLNGEVTTEPACFSLAYLYKEAYFDKGPQSNPKYTGSVLITPDESGKIYTYKYWISNSSYVLSEATPETKGKSAVKGTSASETCGTTSGTGTTVFAENGKKSNP